MNATSTMDLGLRDRVVLITGGSSGIGAALAAAYGRQGARVAITYHRDEPGADRVIDAVRESGGDAISLRFDLADPDGAAEVADRLTDRWGTIDVFVANAVQWPDRAPGGRFEDHDPASWQRGLRVNVEGTLAVVQAVVPSMRTAGWGRILFVSSGLAEEGMAGSEIYTTAKAALHGLARSLSWSLGPDGILVNVLAAGLTLTERNRSSIPSAVRHAVAARQPLKRLSDPEELAPPALFLTSAINTSITGEVLHEGSSAGRSSHA